MKSRDKINLLRGEIARSVSVLVKIENHFLDFRKEKIDNQMCGINEAMVVAQALSNYYTCVETLFFPNFLRMDLIKTGGISPS